MGSHIDKRDSTGHRRSVFLAGPFKALVDPERSRMPDGAVRRYAALIARLEAAGYEVHNAHRREGWGERFLTPEECTRRDFEEIRDCHLFVALPGDPPSPGTHIEIGWASALGKPIVLLLEEGATYAFLVRGLHTVANVTYVRVPAGEDGAEQLGAALAALERSLP